MVEPDHRQRRLRWQSTRVVQQTILTLTAHGVPMALPQGTVLFGPVAQSGDFATMVHGSESYKCHIDELLRYTVEANAATAAPHEKVA